MERREVVQQRCALGLFLPFDLLDGPVLSGDFRDDPVGALEVAEDPRLVSFEPDALVGRLERSVDEPVRLGDERLDLALPLDDHRERRCLHTAERHDAADPSAAANRRGARGVHPDEPVGFRA